MLGLKESPWIIHYDASSCNGCDIETLACLTPIFDVERLGVVNTGNPKHADIFLVTGAVNEQCKTVIRTIYDQMPEPKVVVAVGTCASSGGIFRDCYNICGGVDCVIPVDVYVGGCAARPEAIIDGVVKAIGVLDSRHRALVAQPETMDKIIYRQAEKRDALEILALQQVAYQRDAELYGEANVPALQQTVAELEADLEQLMFLKAVRNGKIIGTARGSASEGTVEVNRVMVHPFYWRQRTGQRLLQEVEQSFPEATRLEAAVAQRSEGPLQWLLRQGYHPFRTDGVAPAVAWVHLRKERA